MANLKNKLNQLADKTKQAAEQKAKTTTATTTKKSSGAGAAVSNITQAAQAAVQNKQQGSQGVTQASINRMEKAAQQNPNQTIADRQKAIRSGQKVTASPTQTAKPTITAGRESTTPLAKAAGSSNIKNKLVQTQIKTDQRRKANLSRLGKDSTIGRDFGYTRDRDLTAVTITPAQQLNSLATRINDNEQQLINWGRRLSVLKAKANRGDEGAVASYNLLADKYNAAFEDYVSDIGAYNKLYNGAYRDSSVRGKYAQREYMQQRQANRDLGARRSYQQRLNEEETRAPQETTLRRKGASVGEHSYKRITGEEPREAGYTFTYEPTRLQQWGRAIHNSYVGNMKAAAGAFYRNSIPEGGSVSGMNSEIGVSDQSKARLQYWSNELLSSGREQSNLGTYQTKLASQGLGTFGTFIVDASIAGVQMLMDMGISVVTGGSMLPAMFVRSMGGGYLTAEQMGASDEEALAYGIGVGAVEALSEKMFSVFSIGNRFAKGAVNKEMSERIIDRLVKHMATTPEGKTALSRLFTLLFATGSEGLEEVAAGIMEPVIRKFTMDPELDISSEIDWQEALYEGLIGGLLGGIGGAVDLPNTKGTYWKYYKEGLDEGIQRYEEAVKKHGLESKEAMKAAKEIWTAGNEKLNAVVGTRDGRPVTIHQLAAAEAATRYGRTDAEGNQVQGPRLADSLNLNNYLEQEENARKEAENQRLEAARREEAARLEAEEKARVATEKPAQTATEGETVRLDTARSAQNRTDVNNVTPAPAIGQPAATPTTQGIPAEEMTQEEKDELQYGSGAVEDLGKYSGLAQRMGAPSIAPGTQKVDNMMARLQRQGALKGFNRADEIENKAKGVFHVNSVSIEILRELTGLPEEVANAAHEAGHLARYYDPELLQDVLDLMRSRGTDIDALVTRKALQYQQRFEKAGVKWDPEEYDRDYFEEEVMAEFIGNICKADTRYLDMIAAEKPSLLQRLINFFRRLVYEATGDQRAVFEKTIERMNAALEKAGEAKGGGGDRYTFGGENAVNADLDALGRAVDMDAAGTEMRDIFRETGWFKGADGKWRFEIDDSKMKYRHQGDLNYMTDPEYREYLDLWDKVVAAFEPAEDEELDRFYELDQRYKNVVPQTTYRLREGGAVLSDIIDHEELFENYPQLRNAGIRFDKLDGGTLGIYNAIGNSIILDNSLRDAPEDTLVHEIQHALQDIEGFAKGASPEYWQRRSNQGTAPLSKSEQTELDNLNRLREKAKTEDPELSREVEDFVASRPTEPRQSLSKNPEDYPEGSAWRKYFEKEDALIEKYGADAASLISTINAINSFHTWRNPFELYQNTAGEIEARDVTARRKMSEEQRRNTMPDTGNEDTVFAEDNPFNRSAEYDEERAHIKQQLENSKDILNKMEPVADIKVPEHFAGKEAAADWAVEQLKSTGYQVDHPVFGWIHFEEKYIRRGAKYADTPAEKAAFLALPKVLKRGINIAEHKNHDDRQKQTFTLAAPVVLNGIRGNMAVVINRRGNHYYAHRILLPDNTVFRFGETKKDTVRELSRGVAESSSLAKTTSTASDIMIPDAGENVKPEADLQTTIQKLTEQVARLTDRLDGKESEAGKQEAPAPVAEAKPKKSTQYNMTVVLEEATVDKYLADYAVESNPNYAKAYITMMSPDDFLALTTKKSRRWVIDETTKPLDTKELANVTRHQPFRLRINTETGKVIGHEGRHRMNALRREGIENVPVLLFDDSNKYSKQPMDSLTLHGQDFDDTRSDASRTVEDVLPLSYANRDQIVERFATQPKTEEIYERYGRETVRYSFGSDLEEAGVTYDADTESVAPSDRFNLTTWNGSEYVQDAAKAAKEISQALGISEKKARKYIDDINSVAKMIADDKARLDFDAAEGLSPMVSNAEYGESFDFSTLCKKRRLFTGTFTAIQSKLKNTALTPLDVLNLRKMMKDAGLEVPCGLCYVEGSRAGMGKFAQEFINLYKKYNPDAEWMPTMKDVNTPDGVESMRMEHPEVYKEYEHFWNNKGTLRKGDKNLFGTQQKPKLYMARSAYNGEVLKKFSKGDKVIDKNEDGGLRIQSFSDFEIANMLDMMQVLMDMSRVGLAGQAYTKVPEFARAFGATGLKINLSLIAKDVDADGKLIFDDVEGMPFATAMEIRSQYSKNVGTILVVFDDAQLKAAMADERIDFIIPFHRSQWTTGQYEALGLPATTKDYTNQQGEKWFEKRYHESSKEPGKMVETKIKPIMSKTYWDYSKTGKENAEEYLRLCKEDGRRPVFYKLLVDNGDGSYSLQPDGSTDGYWKTLIDFKMYDNEGNGAPQLPVRPDFSMDEISRIMNEYEGGHGEFPVADKIVDKYVREYKKEHKGDRFSFGEEEEGAEAEAPKDLESMEPSERAKELIAAAAHAKQVQKQTQKILRSLRLNEKEHKLVDSLLSGALTVDELPGDVNRRGIERAYEARKAAREAQAPVDEYNKQRRAALDKTAEALAENSDEWKDRKSRFGYDRETARRNIQHMVKDEAEANALIRTYIDPIREHEAEKNRMVARYNARIKALKLETRTRRGNQVSEAHAVQYVGELEFIRDWLEQLPEGETRGDVTYDEAMSLLNEFWTENPNLDKARIHAAVAEFRSIYDEIFAMINEARVLNGYAPIDYRKGYFPHFTSNSADSIIQSLANGLGLGVEVTELPTSIAGTTHLFRPGIQWSGHMLQRTGNDTDYNALEGWDRYIPAVANIIYHTEDIQNLRALERVLRSKYSDTTVRDEIERTRNDRNLTETQKNSILDELFKRDTTQLNYFVQWLREYTNQLAGKRADLDRVAEAEAGRKLYRIVQKFENRVAANMLGGNLSSAMTNFVPLFQAWGNVRTSSMLRAMWDTTVGAIKHDGFRDGSDFLVNRRGYEAMYQTLFDKTKDKLFIPFNIIDDFVSETIVRARYYDELRSGLGPEAALMAADTFAGSVLADRAVGELPVIFNSKNPFVKVFTMFQVEVNNDLSHFFKDIPRDAKKKGMAAVFFCILKYVLGVHIFNDLFEALFGRRISFDPLDMLNDLAADATGYKLPNGFELAADLIRTGEWKGWEAFESDKGDDFFGDLLGKDGDLISWLENLPFLGSLLGGGRYPILSALPEQAQFSSGLQAFADLIKKEDEQENADAYDLQKMYKAVRAPLAYFIPPAFGGQARKIAEGLYAASKGGSYTITTEGDKRLQYPIEGVADVIRASIFGKTATRGGKQWVRSDFDTLSVDQTEAYIDLVTAGSDSQKIYDILHDLKGEERDSIAKAYALASADLKDSERVRLLDALVSESQSEKFAAMMTEGGLTFRQCAEVYDKYHELSKMGELKDSDDSYVYKKAYLATQFAAWIDGEGYTDEQKEVIEGQYKFWNMVPAEAGNYERFTAAGLSIDKALDLTDDWSQLKALPGATYVSTAQKIGAVAAAGYLTEKERQNVVRSLMDDEKNADGVSQQTKFDQYIVGYQVPIECYSQYLTQSNGLKGDDLNGDGKTDSGSLVKKKLAVIDRLPLQPGQKTALALFATGNAESTIRKYAPWLR